MGFLVPAGWAVLSRTGDVVFVRGPGSPEATITGAVGSLALDTTNGVGYIKNTGAGNTGWAQLGNAGNIHVLKTVAGDTLVEATEVAAGRRIVALNQITALTTTQMPANTGDGVVFLAYAQTAPTASPVGGAILYVDPSTHSIMARTASGFVNTISPNSTTWNIAQNTLSFQANIGDVFFTQAVNTTGNGTHLHVTAQDALQSGDTIGGDLYLGAGASHGAGALGSIRLLSALILSSPTLTIATGAVSPTWRQTDAASGNSGTDWIHVAQAGVGTNKSGGNYGAYGGASTGTGLPGGFFAKVGGSTGPSMLQVVSLSATAGVPDGNVVVLCRASGTSRTQVPDGDGLVYVGNAAVGPSTPPVSGFLFFSNGGAPRFWGSNTSALQLELTNSLGGAINLTALTSTNSLNIVLGGISYKIPLI